MSVEGPFHRRLCELHECLRGLGSPGGAIVSSTSQRPASAARISPQRPSPGQVAARSKCSNKASKHTHDKRRSRWMQMRDGKVRRCLRKKKKKESLNEERDSLHFSFSILGRLDFVPIFLRPPLCLFPLSPALCRGILGKFFFSPLSGSLHIPFKVGHTCCRCVAAAAARTSLRAPGMMRTLHLCPSDTTPHAYGCTSARARCVFFERAPAVALVSSQWSK